MAEKKMTKATAMALGAEALAVVNPEAAEILAKEAARLSAPRKATGKVSKEQVANMEAADALLLSSGLPKRHKGCPPLTMRW